jgi:hypothetical protein
MSRKVLVSVFALLVLTSLAWGADKSWTGVVSDSGCGAKHSTAGDDAAACVAKCVSNGAKYVLVSNGKVYQLSPQDKISSSLAGRSVKISGSLSGDTITVSSATAANGGEKRPAGM